jgi:hypothetical protein
VTIAAERVVLRFRTAESVGEPKELLRLFEHAVAAVEDKVPEAKIQEAKAVLEPRVQAGLPGYSAEVVVFQDLAYAALFAIKHGQRKVAEPGHRLFLSILQSYTLPPALRKKVEIASRVYLKEANPRYKNKSGAAAILERLQVYERYRDLLRTHLLIAKEAIAKGKAHVEEGAGSTKRKVGPFTLVNTGGFKEKVMDEVADVIQKVIAYAQSSGLGSVCYGEVQVTNTLSKANVLAFYLLANDELFIRANVKSSSDAVRTVLHELGHRYEHKFLNSSREVQRLYSVLSGQEIRRKYDREKTKGKLPDRGETLVSKGKTYVVTQTVPDYKAGYKIYLERQDDPQSTGSITLDGWLAMKGETSRDVDTDPNYIGFVTDYAKRGGPSENFAEMFAYYCVGRLPVLQSAPFEELVFGKMKTAAQRQAHRIASQYLLARQYHLPVVYVPSQTSVGFSVIVPTPKDASDLTHVLGRSRLLGRGRMRTQKSYMLEAVELHWMPTGAMPTLREFVHEVEQWARRNGYLLARDMRQLRQGLDELRS